MARLDCSAVGRWLSAYHDDELSIADRIVVDAHICTCPACAREAQQVRELSEALRAHAAVDVDAASSERVRAAGSMVVSRLAAEHKVSESRSLGRLLEDLHLVWVTGAAIAVTLACALTLSGMVQLSYVRNPASLAAVMLALSNPGSNANPVQLRQGIVAPRMSPEVALASLPVQTPLPGEPAGVTLAAVLTREGTIAGLEVLRSSGPDPSMWDEMVLSAASARFHPAEYGGTPVAVNMVWIMEQMTVQGDDEAGRAG